MKIINQKTLLKVTHAGNYSGQDGNRFAEDYTPAASYGGDLVNDECRFGLSSAGNTLTWLVFSDGTMISKPNQTGTKGYAKVKEAADRQTYFFSFGESGEERFGKNGIGEPFVDGDINYTARFFYFDETDNPNDFMGKYLVPTIKDSRWGWGSTSFQLMNPEYMIKEGVSSSPENASLVYAVLNYSTASVTRRHEEVIKSITAMACNFLFIAQPDEYWPWFQDEAQVALGKLRSGFSTPSFRINYESGSYLPSVKVKIDGTQYEEEITNLRANENQTVSVSQDTFDQLSLGEHTMTVEASNNAGITVSKTYTFEKIEGVLELKGNPVEHEERPNKCTLLSAIVLGEGASIEWQVCNNALDASPSWEIYEGEGHTFLNATKTAEKWAVAWKLRIDGTSATTKSEAIKQVGMAVI